MSDVNGWNRDLYVYHLLRGGEYSGSWNADWTARLRLDWEGVPIHIRGDLERTGKYTDQLRVRILVPLELERYYKLTMSTQSPVNRGLNLLQKEDFGCPELSRERRIRTNEEAFTTRALQDEAWKKSLVGCPDCALEVRPVLPGQGGAHILALSVTREALIGYGALPCDFQDDPEKLQKMFRDADTKELEDSLAVRNLDALVELAKRTVRALRTWRM